MRLFVRSFIARILQALLAAMLIFSGGQARMDLPGNTTGFGSLGLPDWFAGPIGKGCWCCRREC